MTKQEHALRFKAAQMYGAGNFVLVNGTEAVSLSDRLMEAARDNMGFGASDPAVSTLKPNTP